MLLRLPKPLEAKSLRSVVAEDPFAAADFYYSPDMLKITFKKQLKMRKKVWSKAKQLAEQQGVQIDTQVVRDSVAAETIIKTAESLHTDLIIMGSHGRKGFQSFS
jgi:nucleotide-binding universal stress UspA family protein